MNTRALLISAGIAGVLAGVLSSVPIISLVNCLLCGWIWGAGILAVYLYRRNAGMAPVTTSTGLIIGLIVGIISAILSSLLGLAFGATTAAALSPDQIAQLEEAMGESARVLTDPAAMGAASFFINLIVQPIFGAIGGLIGSAIFKNRPTQVG